MSGSAPRLPRARRDKDEDTRRDARHATTVLGEAVGGTRTRTRGSGGCAYFGADPEPG
jgi:hypothetical protein